MDEAKRQRAMTDKGLEYATELKRKDRNKLIKTLEAVGNHLKTLLDEGTSCDMPTARDKYKQWMTNYEELLASHQNYTQLLTLSEQEVERLWFETKNS
ncbi:hypothetical protein KUTeg_011133 [Tegillarca granosa]|uniref:Uncharacterized protein n=1 Tax=Tegillarca granosa TaxID=220873 RepID=A0ABQ9F1M8_TEGGR|nr:hypothetical protein KUTeg_011133 [Tegillarca granosa]